MKYSEEFYLMYRMAEWFSLNPVGTPMPEWIILNWPINPVELTECIELYKNEYGFFPSGAKNE